MIMISTPAEVKDVKLNIHVDHKQPMELLKLTDTLVSIAKEYETYAFQNGYTKEDRYAKLYVKEIRSGSTIIDLVEFASTGVIPFVENIGTIVGFGRLLQESFSNFIGNKHTDRSHLSDNSLRNYSRIVEPIAKDNSAQLNISTVVNGDVNMHLHLDSFDCQRIQKEVRRELRTRRIPEDSEVMENVLMTLYQARGDVASKAGNSAIIQEFDDQPHRVRFASVELKEAIVKGDENPFNFAYAVDVKPEYVSKNKVIYFVLDLHESISLNDIE